MTENVKADGLYVLTQPVPMTFPALLEAKPYMKNGKVKGEPKFSCTLNFSPESGDLKALKLLASTLAKAKWPGKKFVLTTTEGVKIHQIVFPFKDGTAYADKQKALGKDREFTRGKITVMAKSKYPPKLGYIQNGKIVELATDEAKAAAKAKFYSGAEVYAELNLVPYDGGGEDGDGKPGISVYLNMILATGKGERLASGRSVSDTFKGYVGAHSMEDPTAPGSDVDMEDF